MNPSRDKVQPPNRPRCLQEGFAGVTNNVQIGIGDGDTNGDVLVAEFNPLFLTYVLEIILRLSRIDIIIQKAGAENGPRV